MEADNSSQTNYSIDLLTSILIDYVVINKAVLDVTTKKLSLFFLKQGNITQQKWQEKKELIQKKYRIFNKLEGYNDTELEVAKKSHDQVTTIKASNKLVNIKSAQINFIVAMMKNTFTNEWVEEKTNINKYDFNATSELLKQAKKESESSYLAYKEGNKIFVFNLTKK